MKALAVSRLPHLFAVAAITCQISTPAHALFDFFKKSQKQAPSVSERQSQEAAAAALLAEGRAAQADGNSGKAIGIYESIIKQYPFTNAAADASFERAVQIRNTGKLQDASDAFQQLITDYRQSPRFSDALQQQFEIAEEAKGGKKQRTMLMVPMKVGPQGVIEMYNRVISNAPYGKLAPLAQFAIAEVHQDQGEKNEAVAAYQAVVDNYPQSSQATEAQFRIGSISNIAAKRTEDNSNLTATRDAMTTLLATDPSSARADEASAILSQVNEAEAAQSLEIGRFYEQQGKPKAAAIYYNEALKFGSADSSSKARELLGALARSYPEAVLDTKDQPAQDYTVPAAVDLRSRDDYAGPPSPELARLSQKPKMRSEGDAFVPIPIQEPTLPTRPGGATTAAPGMLLPPADGADKPPLLPVPPAPGIPTQPPGGAIPPAPAPPAPAEAPAAPAAPKPADAKP